MKTVFLPKGKILVKVAPKAEQVNGFYVPESSKNTCESAEIVAVASEYSKDTEGLNSCIIKEGFGIKVDVSSIWENADKEFSYKVVDMEKDVLIVY